MSVPPKAIQNCTFLRVFLALSISFSSHKEIFSGEMINWAAPGHTTAAPGHKYKGEDGEPVMDTRPN